MRSVASRNNLLNSKKVLLTDCIVLRVAGILLLFSAFILAAPVKTFQNITYEYEPSITLPEDKLIICVPGFTQHNNSAEFNILKRFFQKNDFSYLIINPPQHGDTFEWKPVFTWGEAEVEVFFELIFNALNLPKKYKEIHLLGFSIGAKIVLRLAAHEEVAPNTFASVVAVATPYTVSDINMRMSGDICKFPEGAISGLYAYDRAGIRRILYMVFCGMPKALLKNRLSPASEMNSISVPTLLIHGSDDWLTKSYHSRKLFHLSEASRQISFVPINTRTHAEDMLSRDKTEIRQYFLDVLSKWFSYLQRPFLAPNKTDFDNNFQSTLSNLNNNARLFYSPRRISMLSSPTINESLGEIWMMDAEHNHSPITLSYLQNTEKSTRKLLLTLGPTNFEAPWYEVYKRWHYGLSYNDKVNGAENIENYLSFLTHFGSVITLKRLSYLHGFSVKKSDFERRIWSADLSLMVLDFKLSYGRFFRDKKRIWHIATNLPLIGSADALYFIGSSYSVFLSQKGIKGPKHALKFYAFLGPKVKFLNSRIQLSTSYDIFGFNFNHPSNFWGIGTKISFRER